MVEVWVRGFWELDSFLETDRTSENPILRELHQETSFEFGLRVTLNVA